MKILILAILLFLTSKTQAQTDSTGDKSVNSKNGFYGLVQNGNRYFLIDRQGILQLKKQDAFQKYYRKIYSDSTIQNPNFIIDPNGNLENFMPFIFLDSSESGVGTYFRLKLKP